MSDARWSVGIVVPACDEADLIGACARSLVAALRTVAFHGRIDGWIVVVADSCRDDTARVAARNLDDLGEVVVATCGSVGRARSVGTEVALAHFARRGAPLDRLWLMATDADTTAPLDWVRGHLGNADAGAVGVAGIVTVASFDEHPPHVADAYRTHYAIQPDGRHPHLHGANLGVRADAYVDVGGWRPLDTGEDHDLWERLRARGHPVVSTIHAPVVTSGRRRGRAPDGFAAFLTRLGAEEITRSS